MNDLVKGKKNEVAYTKDQVSLIKKTICVGATDDELKLFLHVAKTTGLDPFSRQIHAVKRSGKLTIQMGIDGYRLIAHRTGRCAGISLPEFTYKKGRDGRDLDQIDSASVTVKRIVAGNFCEFSATAFWDEYAPKDSGFMWRDRPKGQLSKCAEALALRKAFPAELSGLYTDEELHSEDSIAEEVEKSATRPSIDYVKLDKQIICLIDGMKAITAGQTLKEKGALMISLLGIKTIKALESKTNEELDVLITKVLTYEKEDKPKAKDIDFSKPEKTHAQSVEKEVESLQEGDM